MNFGPIVELDVASPPLLFHLKLVGMRASYADV